MKCRSMSSKDRSTVTMRRASLRRFQACRSWSNCMVLRLPSRAANAHYVPRIAKARYFAGALVRGRIPDNPWRYDPRLDGERLHATEADQLVANSRATAEKVLKIGKCGWESGRSVYPHSQIHPAALTEFSAAGDNWYGFVSRQLWKCASRPRASQGNSSRSSPRTAFST